MKRTIFAAVFTLSAFTVVDRALGFVFKIFLSRNLGAEALGVYQVALSFFFVLLTATTSGIPLIVSKLTARYRLTNEIRRERALTCAALVVGLTVSLVLAGAVILLYRPLGSFFAERESSTVLLLLLPALIFSAVYSAFRGNLWGRQRYFVVSLVEILEQIVRIAACVLLFAAGFDRLYSTALSLSIGCLASMLAVTACFFALRGSLASPRREIVPLLKSSTPITVSRAASSLVGSLEAVAVPFLLMTAGYSRERSMALYGAGVGMALPLLYIPITVVGSLAFVMIPTVSTGMARGRVAAVNAQIESALGFSAVIAAAFVPMFTALGAPLGTLVYDNAEAGRFLAAAAWLLVPLSVENITSSVMNSLDLELRSFVNYLVGSGVMFATLFAFYGAFDITVLALGMGLGQTVACVLHIAAIRKKTGLGFSYMGKLIKSVLLVFPAAFVAKCVRSLALPLGEAAALILGCAASLVFFAGTGLIVGLIDLEFFRGNVVTSALRKKSVFRRKSLAKKRTL